MSQLNYLGTIVVDQSSSDEEINIRLHSSNSCHGSVSVFSQKHNDQNTKTVILPTFLMIAKLCFLH
jgi:hypothetical protein